MYKKNATKNVYVIMTSKVCITRINTRIEEKCSYIFRHPFAMRLLHTDAINRNQIHSRLALPDNDNLKMYSSSEINHANKRCANDSTVRVSLQERTNRFFVTNSTRTFEETTQTQMLVNIGRTISIR